LKRFVKTVFWSCAIGGIAAALSLTAPSEAKAYPAEYGVKVQVNDSIVAFPEAQPFIDPSGTLLVPIRNIAEKMGYKVDWAMSNSSISLKLSDGNKVISLKTGSTEANVNGKSIKTDVPPVLANGMTYVPLRFISESFGYMLQWDDANGVAIICQDGQYHAPAWYVPAKKTLADMVSDTSKYYIGIRYMWGGTTTNGFDCSGFVNYVFDQYGIDLPRTSKSMYDTAGTRTVGLAPGDLVFFNIGKGTTHVGIYLGNDQFISATSSSGIKIDSITSNYWGSKFIGANRVV
jgi:peptidoglycan endopeptidase LytE